LKPKRQGSSPTPYSFVSMAHVQQPGAELTQVMGLLQKILGALA
jgi:hypothetical protein